jgi:hypothetical protein
VSNVPGDMGRPNGVQWGCPFFPRACSPTLPQDFPCGGSRVLVSLLTLCPNLSAAKLQAGEPVLKAAPSFVERPGEFEFMGSMIARPVQVGRIEKSGLLASKAGQNAAQAID